MASAGVDASSSLYEAPRCLPRIRRRKRFVVFAVAAVCLACGGSGGVAGGSASDPRLGAASEEETFALDLPPPPPQNSFERESLQPDDSVGFRPAPGGIVDFESLQGESRSGRRTASSASSMSSSMGRRSGSSKRKGRRRRSVEADWRSRVFSLLDGQRMEQISEYKEVLLLSMLVLVLAIRAIHLEVSFRLKPDKLAESMAELERRTEAYELNKTEVAEGRAEVEDMMQWLVRREAELANRKEDLKYGEAALEGERLVAIQRAQVKAERKRFVEELEEMRQEFEEELQGDFKVILETLKRHLLYLSQKERELNIDPKIAGKTPLPEPPSVRVVSLQELTIELNRSEEAYKKIRQAQVVEWADVKRAKEEMHATALRLLNEVIPVLKEAQRRLWEFEVEDNYFTDPESIASDVNRHLEKRWKAYERDQQQLVQEVAAQNARVQELRKEVEAVRQTGDAEKMAIAEITLLDADTLLEVLKHDLEVPRQSKEDFLLAGTEAAQRALVEAQKRKQLWKSREAAAVSARKDAEKSTDYVTYLQSLAEKIKEVVHFNAEDEKLKVDPRSP